MGAGLQLHGISGPWQSNPVPWSTLGFTLGLCFILSTMQLEYTFICCFVSHIPLLLLAFLLCQAEEFVRTSSMQKCSRVVLKQHGQGFADKCYVPLGYGQNRSDPNSVVCLNCS